MSFAVKKRQLFEILSKYFIFVYLFRVPLLPESAKRKFCEAKLQFRPKSLGNSK
jgi:hypothetical protein